MAAGRVRLTLHFRARLGERGMLWADVLGLFESPTLARADGFDDAGRARWIERGRAADGAAMGWCARSGATTGAN